MKKYYYLIALGVITFNACVVKPIPTEHNINTSENAVLHETFLNESTDSFRSKIEIAGEKLIRAMVAGDFSDAKLLMSKTLIDKSTSEGFKLMKQDIEKNCGKLVSIQYLGDLQNTLFRTALFKVAFQKEVNGKPVKMEIPCQIGYGIEEGVPKAMLINFAPVL